MWPCIPPQSFPTASALSASVPSLRSWKREKCNIWDQIKSFTGGRGARKICGVSGVSSNGRHLVAQPHTSNRADLMALVQTALQRSQEYLLSEQKPEGYWVGELM